MANGAEAVKEGTVKQLIDNDKVLVYEVTYKPGEGTSVRERKAGVTRALSGGTMLLTYPDGRTEEKHWQTGETQWLPQRTVGNKNVGKTAVELLVIQLK
jgi:hypothetical protein